MVTPHQKRPPHKRQRTCGTRGMTKQGRLQKLQCEQFNFDKSFRKKLAGNPSDPNPVQHRFNVGKDADAVITALTMECAFCDGHGCNGLDCVMSKTDGNCFYCGSKIGSTCSYQQCVYGVSRYACTTPNCDVSVDPKTKRGLAKNECQRCHSTSWKAMGAEEFETLNGLLKWHTQVPKACGLCFDYREAAKGCWGKCAQRGLRKRIRCLLIKSSHWMRCDFGVAVERYYSSGDRAAAFLAAMDDILDITSIVTEKK